MHDKLFKAALGIGAAWPLVLVSRSSWGQPWLPIAIAGADASAFNINPATGIVTFKSSPDFESPSDVGHNNIYDILVTASDGSLSTSKAVAEDLRAAD